MKKRERIRYGLKLHLRGVKELHQVTPAFFPVLTLYSVFRAITPYVTVFFSAQILRELAGSRNPEILWKWVWLGVIAIGVTGIGKAVLCRRYNTLLNDLWGRKEILFIRKMFSLDFAELDKQENHDLRAQIRQNENWSGWGLMKVYEVYLAAVTSGMGLLSGMVLTFRLFTSPVPKAAGWLICLNHPFFLLLLAGFMAAISIFAGNMSAKATKCWSACAKEVTYVNRLFDHFGAVGYEKERSMDIRLNQQEKLVHSYWKEFSHAVGVKSKIGKAAQGEMGIYASLGVGMTTWITGLIYVFTCLKALGGAFGVGSITQYVGAATAMVENIFSLTDLIGTLETNTPYLEKTFAFLDIPNAMYQGSLTTEKRSDRKYEIEFQNVSFSYPGSERFALRHVNLKFQIGKRLAIVGENGSGKTTLIKLLCRLYDPQEGQILLNGIDIRKYRYDDYKDLFSVVFQDFQLVCQPIGANVAGKAHYDRERVEQALIDAGFGERLSRMEQGMDTMIYKNLSEDGIDISGGEAQKIAIARALYKDAPFLILDEPTAALDPIAEAEIYSKFNDIAGDKTAIYISHRLSSCKFCDEIAVFHQGEVIQQGSHEELVRDEKGKYFELWHAQAQYYMEGEKQA